MMTTSQEFTERRQHARHPVQNGIIAMSKSSSITIGTLLDISLGGLAARYAFDDENIRSTFDIDILLTDTSFFLTNIPVSTVSDFELENQVPYSLIHERRCGLEFGELSEQMVEQIKTLVQTFGTDIL